MATATLQFPFDELHGAIAKKDDVYIRVVNGKHIIQHKPRMKSAKRIEACKAFGKQFGTERKKSSKR
ncbi:MAG: hypothetical protein MJZ92_01120 [Paludibacteraceae bacterium]|nr:hypothetical protein [Paludibacteraceae bacterium]